MYKFFCEHQVFISLGQISRSGMAGLYCKHMLNFIRICQTDFRVSAILHFHQQCGRVSSSCSASSLVFGILICWWWWGRCFNYSHSNRCGVVWIFISLTANDFEQLFISLSAICITSLLKCSFTYFCLFLKLYCCLLTIEFWKLFTCSGYKSCVGYTIC